MENDSSKAQFIQRLIDDSLKYQMLYKTEKNKNNELEESIKILIVDASNHQMLCKAEKNKTNDLETIIKTLNTTIAEKETEIKDLKQKNMKHLMEIGVQVSRYRTLSDKYKQLEQDMSNLSIKYDEISQKLNRTEQMHLQNLNVLIYEYFELKKLIEHDSALSFLCEFK